MDNTVTRDLQMIEKNMLARLTAILDKHSIPYFLAYGTLLGAVRHKGFIPWDDDIDIHIWAEDYEKLRIIFATEDTGSLELHDIYTIEDYPFIFPKIVESTTKLVECGMSHYNSGVYIDIFPLFSVNDNIIINYIESAKHYFYYAIVRIYYVEWTSKSRRLLQKITKLLFNVSKIQKKIYHSYTRNKQITKYVKDPYLFSRKDILRREYFEKTVKGMFEGLETYLPIEYEKCLEQKYGAYMELPKEEERVSRHQFKELRYDVFMKGNGSLY